MSTRTARYNPPPNWPAPPRGWQPPRDWQPDPAWGPLPADWQLWLPHRPERRKHTAILAEECSVLGL